MNQCDESGQYRVAVRNQKALLKKQSFNIIVYKIIARTAHVYKKLLNFSLKINAYGRTLMVESLNKDFGGYRVRDIFCFPGNMLQLCSMFGVLKKGKLNCCG